MKWKNIRWSPLAPKLLRPVLNQPIPVDLLEKAAEKFGVLADLDNSSMEFYSLGELQRLADLVVKEVTIRMHRWPKSMLDTQIGPFPGSLKLEMMNLDVRTYNCLVKAGYGNSPDELSIATIRNLLAIPGFGAKSLIDLLAKIEYYFQKSEDSGDIDIRSINSCHDEAFELLNVKHASEVYTDDPRLGVFLRRIKNNLQIPLSPKNYNASEIAGYILEGENALRNPKTMSEAIRDLKIEIHRLINMTLEDELLDFLDPLTCRDKIMIAKRLGWDGNGGSTLQEAGRVVNITRERARQLETRAFVILGTFKNTPFAPALDKALNLLKEMVPSSAGIIGEAFKSKGISKESFEIRGIESAAKYLGREFPFDIKSLRSGTIILPLGSVVQPKTIRNVARKMVERYGVSLIDDIISAIKESTDREIDRKAIEISLTTMKGFEWIDYNEGLFLIATCNHILNKIAKIMCVMTAIPISELHAAIKRSCRGDVVTPSQKVLLSLCRHIKNYRVSGDRVIVEQPHERKNILSKSEQCMVKILDENGPLLELNVFEDFALAMGMTRSNFYNLLGRSPIFYKYAVGVYGLLGAIIPDVVAKEIASRKYKRKVIQGYGWTSEGNIWIGYRMTSVVYRQGSLRVPYPCREIISGEFQIRVEGKTNIGTLVVKGSAFCRLSKLIAKRHWEENDILLLVFDRKNGIVDAIISDENFKSLFQRVEGEI